MEYVNIDFEEQKPHEIFEYVKQSDVLAKQCDIYILSYKTLHTVVLDKGKVIAALWFGSHGNEVDFDVCVHDAYRKKGICKELVKIACEEANDFLGAGLKIRLEVVNEHLVNMLIREGFTVRDNLHDRTVMEKKNDT